MARQQIEFGVFQDAEGNPLSLGYLTVRINTDAVSGTGEQVSAGIVIKVPFDVNGAITTRAEFWPTDQLTPSNTRYIYRAYTARGQLVWELQTGLLTSTSLLLQESGPLILQEDGLFGILIT